MLLTWVAKLMQVTRLGMRLAECGCEWLEWRKSLSVFLEVLEDEMPVLPATQHETALEVCFSCVSAKCSAIQLAWEYCRNMCNVASPE